MSLSAACVRLSNDTKKKGRREAGEEKGKGEEERGEGNKGKGKKDITVLNGKDVSRATLLIKFLMSNFLMATNYYLLDHSLTAATTSLNTGTGR